MLSRPTSLAILMSSSIGFVFNGEESEIQNWLGKFGAYIAHRFLKIWYGIASYLFILVFFILTSIAVYESHLLWRKIKSTNSNYNSPNQSLIYRLPQYFVIQSMILLVLIPFTFDDLYNPF